MVIFYILDIYNCNLTTGPLSMFHLRRKSAFLCIIDSRWSEVASPRIDYSSLILFRKVSKQNEK